MRSTSSTAPTAMMAFRLPTDNELPSRQSPPNFFWHTAVLARGTLGLTAVRLSRVTPQSGCPFCWMAACKTRAERLIPFQDRSLEILRPVNVKMLENAFRQHAPQEGRWW